jgi:hypothetical protein
VVAAADTEFAVWAAMSTADYGPAIGLTTGYLSKFAVPRRDALLELKSRIFCLIGKFMIRRLT